MRVCAALLVVLCARPLVSGAEEGEVRRFSWRPSVVVRGVADDNVRQSDHGADEDLWFWASPRLELGYRAPAFDLGADVGAEVHQYSDNTDLNEVFYHVKSHAEAGLLPGLTMRLSDTFVPQPEVLGRPDDDASNQQQTNRVAAELRYGHSREERREFSLGLRGARFDSEAFPAVVYAPGGVARTDPHFHADYWEGGAFVELRSAVGGRSSLYLRGQGRLRRFDEASFSDHTSILGQLGLESRWLARGLLDVAVGWGTVDYRSGSAVPRFIGHAKLEYRAGNGWAFELGAHQRFTTELSGGEFVDTTGRLGVEKSFGRLTVANLTGFVSYLDNESISPRTNLFGGVELGIRRQLSRQLQVGVAYRHWSNGGAYAGDDFSQNRIMLTLGYHYKP